MSLKADKKGFRLNTNTRKVCFWLISYLLQDRELLELVHEETKPAISHGSAGLDVHHLVDHCPRLDGLFQETMRMTAFSASVRLITEDTKIGDSVLYKGKRMIIPFRQLHLNEEVFGGDVTSFQATRFLEREKPLKSSSWRPFGGGVTVCPGRFLAKQSVMAFIALLLHRFEINLYGPQGMPQRELRRPTLGIVSRKEGTNDLLVQLTQRSIKQL